jgi:hypothetical protein
MGMQGITIKLPEAVARQLREEARQSGRRPRWELGRRPIIGHERSRQVPAPMTAICDTGPLLAYLNRNDPHHRWAVALMKQVRAPMLVSEPVLTEVIYSLREDGLAIDPLFQLLEREVGPASEP